jgi:hypothetical protein
LYDGEDDGGDYGRTNFSEVRDSSHEGYALKVLLLFDFLKCGSHLGQKACPHIKVRRASWGDATTKKKYEKKYEAGPVKPTRLQ